MAGAGPVVRADGRREDDERLSRRLEVVIQAPLADQQVHDPRKLRIDGDDLVPVVTSTPCADADGRDILRDIGGDRRVSLDDHHVGCFVRVREVETRNEQLLDVLLKSSIPRRPSCATETTIPFACRRRWSTSADAWSSSTTTTRVAGASERTVSSIAFTSFSFSWCHQSRRGASASPR